ncbi:MAG: hypothetical protein HDT27_03155 [Subdoligranulum sp.]|nr:hypothetical protein [Subdoligranulum sp.]
MSTLFLFYFCPERLRQLCRAKIANLSFGKNPIRNPGSAPPAPCAPQKLRPGHANRMRSICYPSYHIFLKKKRGKSTIIEINFYKSVAKAFYFYLQCIPEKNRPFILASFHAYFVYGAQPPQAIVRTFRANSPAAIYPDKVSAR